MQVLYSPLPVLPPRRSGDVPGVDLIASLPDIQLFTIVSDTTWGAIRVTFRNASQGKTAEGNIHHRSACARPWVFSDHNKTDMNIKLGCSFQASPHQYKSLLWSTKSQHYQREKTSLPSQSETQSCSWLPNFRFLVRLGTSWLPIQVWDLSNEIKVTK